MGEQPAAWGEHRAHAHASAKNVTNACLMLSACLPAIWLVVKLREACTTAGQAGTIEDAGCKLYYEYPNVFLNFLFFGNITVGFWIIGLIQKSFWLIDPYWTLFPVLASLFYATHPSAVQSRQFSFCLWLTWAWAVRLTFNYFRREKWKFGEREDWRYTAMAKSYGRKWWWMSFWFVGAAQQLMLCPLVYPIYVISVSGKSDFAIMDCISVLGCLSGLVIAFFADNQLYDYCSSKRTTKAPVLRTGLWQYSRHPNYAGELLWWWSLACFSNCYASLIGPIINTCVLLRVTELTEKHMESHWKSSRVIEYKEYAEITPAWIPFQAS